MIKASKLEVLEIKPRKTVLDDKNMDQEAHSIFSRYMTQKEAEGDLESFLIN